jgi:hypothetical protein
MNRRLYVCIVTTIYPRHEGDSVPRFVADLAANQSESPL